MVHMLSPAAASQAPGPTVLWGPCCPPVPALQHLPQKPLTAAGEEDEFGVNLHLG